MSAQKLVVYKNGDFALGEFTDDNTRAGSVQYQSVKGPQYIGEFDENLRKGPGTIKFDFEDDYRFEGMYDQNKKNGFGKFESHLGLTEGMFSEGILEGYGRNVTSEGLFYEGYFQEGKKEGYGLEVQPNSDVFIGEFRRDKKEGVGLYLFAKGGYYYGFFRNNEKSGLGVLYSRFNYAYYFGEFAADRKEGRGIEVFKDRSVYNGFYESNKRSGPGIMEYSNKSTYVGEWKNGVRSGKGRCEAGKLVTSGNWEYDRIKVACAVDLDELMQPLYDYKLPANIEGHLKQMSYAFMRKMLPDLNLNTMLKPPLLDSLKLRAAQGLIRGHILRKISNILNNSVVLNEVSDGIYKAFTQVPDHQKVFAPIGDRVDFKFQSGEYKIRWIGINFDDKKKPTFQLDHMIISNDIIFGFSSEEKQNQYQLDGVCLPNGCLQIYQEFKSSREVQKFTCVCGPNYLVGMDGEENKVFLIPDLQMYKGFFINGEDVHEKIPIALYLRIFGKEKIYGFGRDKIGIYMVSGTSKPGNSSDPRPLIEFSCLYERDYEISFKGRLEGDEIRGEWKSLPHSGKFMLRLNPKYNVKNIEMFVKGSHDTGVIERLALQNTILTNLLMPTENQRAMRRALSKNLDPALEHQSRQFGMTQEELSVEIDGHKARPKAVVKKDKASLYQGNESIYDAYHEALSKKFHRDLLAEFQNSPLAVCELFDAGKGNESTRTRERSVDKRSLRLSVMGGAARKDTKTSIDTDPVTPSKIGRSATGGSMRDRTGSKSSVDSDALSADEDQYSQTDPRKNGDSPNEAARKPAADKASKPKRDPRRLIPIKVDDRSQVQPSATKSKGGTQSKEGSAVKPKQQTSRQVEQAELEREQKRREMNARRDQKIKQLRGEKEFGIETDEKLREEIQRDVKKSLQKGTKNKPAVREGIRIGQGDNDGDVDGGLEIPPVVFREIDSDEEERIVQRKFARVNGDEPEASEPSAEPKNNRIRRPQDDDSSDDSPKPLGRRNQKNNPAARGASKGSQDSESVEYSRSSLKQSSKQLRDYHHGPELSYDEEAIDGDVYDEDDDPDLAGVTDKRQREEIIAYKHRLAEAAQEEAKLDEYRSIVRRVCALRSYKFDSSAPIKPHETLKTDISRVALANFRFSEDVEMEAALDKHEFATVKQIENEALFEILWRGSITTLGKKQTFFVENLIPCAGFFRGCMVYDDTFLILKGDYEQSRDPNTHLPFSLEAYEETSLRYRLKGRFVKYDIEMTMEQVGSEVSIPMTLQISFKSVACTIYSEPYKTILAGRCKISHVLLVVFYNNETLNVFCGKRNKQGVFVARHMKDGQLQENITLRQTRNPKKVNSANALTLLDEKSMIGYVIEVHNV